MVGSFRERLADKAYDPLYARAIICNDGPNTTSDRNRR